MGECSPVSPSAPLSEKNMVVGVTTILFGPLSGRSSYTDSRELTEPSGVKASTAPCAKSATNKRALSWSKAAELGWPPVEYTFCNWPNEFTIMMSPAFWKITCKVPSKGFTNGEQMSPLPRSCNQTLATTIVLISWARSVLTETVKRSRRLGSANKRLRGFTFFNSV